MAIMHKGAWIENRNPSKHLYEELKNELFELSLSHEKTVKSV